MKRMEWKGTIESGIRRHLGPQGQQWYRVQMGRRGKGNRASRVCRTLEAAVALKKEWLAGGVERRDDPPAPEASGESTVEDQLRQYPLLRPGARADARSTLAVIRRRYPELLGFTVGAVTPDHFAVFYERYVAAGLKPSGAGTHMNTLRAAIRLDRPDFRVPSDVFPPPNATRHPMLTRSELDRALLATPEPIRTMARLAVLTFMRLTEIRLLQRGQVDLTAQTISLPRAKAGPRTVPLGRAAVDLLRRQLASHPHATVFPRHPRRAARRSRAVGRPYSRGHISDLWRASMRAVRPGFTFHDLRHHAAMTALKHGASFPELQALGGWATPKMVNRYATATNDRLRQLQDRGARGHHAGRRGGGA